MKNLTLFVIMFIVLVNTISCRSSVKPVTEPTGWKVLSFEGIWKGADSLERLYLHEAGFEHTREATVRGRTMRIVIKGGVQGATTTVSWIAASGKESQDPAIPMDRSKARRLFQSYKNKYYVSLTFPSAPQVNIPRPAENYSFCGRRTIKLIRGRHLELVDMRTGIRLARYAIGVDNTLKPIEQLISARWEIQSGRQRGYYEIRCSP